MNDPYLKKFMIVGFIIWIVAGIAMTVFRSTADAAPSNAEPNTCKISAIFEGRDIPLIKPDGSRTMIQIPTRVCWECSSNETRCKDIQD